MAGYLLWAGPLALVLAALVAVALAVVLRQRRAQSRRVRRTRPPASRPTAGPQAPEQAPASLPPPLTTPAAPMPPAAARGEGGVPQAGTTGSIAAQREAASEALRQARHRAAADAARLEASRLAHRSAPVSPGGSTGAAPPPRPPRPAAPVAAAAPAPPVSTPPLPFGTRLTAPALTTLPPPRPAGPGQPLTVLVVDDSKVVRIKTSRLLEKHHYRVLLADDGLSAVVCLETQSADLLITDVEMPGLDGFGLTQRLRASPRWAGLPVIMITSSDDKHRAEAAAAGVDVLLGKPYDEQALLAEVQRALARVQRPASTGRVLQ